MAQSCSGTSKVECEKTPGWRCARVYAVEDDGGVQTGGGFLGGSGGNAAGQCGSVRGECSRDAGRVLRGTVSPGSAGVSSNDQLSLSVLVPPSSAAGGAAVWLGFNCVPTRTAFTTLADGSSGPYNQQCMQPDASGRLSISGMIYSFFFFPNPSLTLFASLY